VCVIVYKTKEAEVSVDTLFLCHTNNPDGMGLMWAERDRVVGSKGDMTFDELVDSLDFYGFLDEKKETVKAGRAVVIHFRWATHGGISRPNTHPFPLAWDSNKLMELWWEDTVGMAHNGIIKGIQEEKELSDTQVYIRDKLSWRAHNIPEYLADIKKETLGSKLIFFYPDESAILTGAWIYEEGVFYSNEDYESIQDWRYGGYAGTNTAVARAGSPEATSFRYYDEDEDGSFKIDPNCPYHDRNCNTCPFIERDNYGGLCCPLYEWEDEGQEIMEPDMCGLVPSQRPVPYPRMEW
jgi:hypothetical protein